MPIIPVSNVQIYIERERDFELPFYPLVHFSLTLQIRTYKYNMCISNDNLQSLSTSHMKCKASVKYLSLTGIVHHITEF